MSGTALDRLRLWLKANLFRRRYEQEMRDEMAAHLEKQTALFVARGLSLDDAKKLARREFGDVAYHETLGRDARGTLWLDALAGDMRFALRHFARRPITTLVMFVILVIGMSLSSMLFSFIHSFSFQAPPAVALNDDLVRIRGMDGPPGEEGPRALEKDEFEEMLKLDSHFSSIAGWTDGDAAFLVPQKGDGSAVISRVNFVTDNYFDVLGLRMAAGVGLPKDAGSDASRRNTVVIEHATWDRVFNKSREAIGSTISLNGIPVTIVGVAPERFTGIYGQTRLQVWMPMAAQPVIAPRGTEGYKAFGRLRAGVAPEAVTAVVNTISQRAGSTTPERIKEKFSSDVETMLAANIGPEFDEDMRLQWVMVGSLALLILLITCTNVSALLTGLASARRQEIAIRLSLGAPRGRIIRQLLTESAVLAVVAGAAALGVVIVMTKTIINFVPQMPIALGITWPLTTFTFVVALAVGIAFGLSPALHATRMALASVMRDSARGVGGTRARLQQSLVVAQIAFTQPLVVALAGFLVLVVSTLQPRVQTDIPDRVIALSVEPTSGVAPTDAERRLLMTRLLQRLEATPGVETAVSDWSENGPYGKYYAIDGGSAAQVPIDIKAHIVAPDYFKVLNVPLKYGRTFGPQDSVSQSSGKADVPVIIGTDLAAKLWGNANAIGRRFKSMVDTGDVVPRMVVVGVVDDPFARNRPDSEPWITYVPVPVGQVPPEILIRTTSDAQALLPTIRNVVNSEAPGAATVVKTLAGIEGEKRRNLHLVYGGITIAAGIALILAAIGLYAVVAFSVAQRTHEIAVRLSVGAGGTQIARKFVGSGLKLSAIGMLIGLPIGLFALRMVMQTVHIFDVALTPVALIAAAAVTIVAAAASWIPARRAAAVDPATVLRSG